MSRNSASRRIRPNRGPSRGSGRGPSGRSGSRQRLDDLIAGIGLLAAIASALGFPPHDDQVTQSQSERITVLEQSAPHSQVLTPGPVDLRQTQFCVTTAR